MPQLQPHVFSISLLLSCFSRRLVISSRLHPAIPWDDPPYAWLRGKSKASSRARWGTSRTSWFYRFGKCRSWSKYAV